MTTPSYVKVICAGNRGGVGKTTAAIMAYGLLVDEGRTPRTIQCERANERKFGKLLESTSAPLPENVDLPEGLEYTTNPKLGYQVYGKVFEALEKPGDVVIDLAAGLTEELLNVARLSEHGMLVENDGDGICLLICVRGSDMTSWDGALAASQAFRETYPKGRVVVVIGLVTEARQVDDVKKFLGGSADGYITVLNEATDFTSRLYGLAHISPHLIYKLGQGETRDQKVAALERIRQQIDAVSLGVVASQYGAYSKWYLNTMTEFAREILGNGRAAGGAADPTQPQRGGGKKG